MAKKHEDHDGHEHEHGEDGPKQRREPPLGELFAHQAAQESAQVARALQHRPRPARLNVRKLIREKHGR